MRGSYLPLSIKPWQVHSADPSASDQHSAKHRWKARAVGMKVKEIAGTAEHRGRSKEWRVAQGWLFQEIGIPLSNRSRFCVVELFFVSLPGPAWPVFCRFVLSGSQRYLIAGKTLLRFLSLPAVRIGALYIRCGCLAAPPNVPAVPLHLSLVGKCFD